MQQTAAHQRAGATAPPSNEAAAAAAPAHSTPASLQIAAALSRDGPFPPLPVDDDRALSRLSSWRRRFLPVPSPLRLIRPWYLMHLASILLYFPVRCWILPRCLSDPRSLDAFEFDLGSSARETQMFLILGVLLFTKVRRSNTWETYVTTTLLFSRFAVLFAAMVTHPALLITFVLLFLTLHLSAPHPPRYEGPSEVHEIGLEYFRERIDGSKGASGSGRESEANSSGGGRSGSQIDPAMTYVVLLYAPADVTCLNFASEFARLSCRYGYAGSTVDFVRVSVDSFASLADQFQVVTPAQNRWEHELPTLLMFQNGRVLARLPEVGGRKTLMDEANIVRAFDLEKRARLPKEIVEKVTKKEKSGAVSAAAADSKKRS